MKINQFTWEKLKKPILALAPMAGVSDSPYRLICRELGADIVYSEMVSVAALCHHSPKTKSLLEFTDAERPLILQIFGSEPEQFAVAAKFVDAEVKPDGLDINFGCPVRDVIKTGAGCYLMKDLARSRVVLEAVLANTTLPVSIKVRTEVGGVTVLDLLDKIAGLDLKAIMIHGRTFSQKFSGPINIELIKEAKKRFKGVVLANGGLHTPESVAQVLADTGCDGVGLARGVMGRPYLFTQAREYLEAGKYQPPVFVDIQKIILRQAKLMAETKGPRGVMEMRKHLGWYVHDFPGAKKLRARFYACTTYAEIEQILLDNPLRFG